MGVHMPIQASRRWGRSRPRPQVPDRRRRSGGRGANRKAANGMRKRRSAHGNGVSVHKHPIV